MPAIVVAVAVLAIFLVGYRYYSSYLARRVYGLDPAFVTPAHELRDGVDFVPTNKHVLFGHHFTSVAGAAPIVGPAIAVFWAGGRRWRGSCWGPSSPPASTTSGPSSSRSATRPAASALSPAT